MTYHDASPSEDRRDRPAAWPSETVIALGRELYEELKRADPMPDDLPWVNLDDCQRDMYCHAATAIVRRYEWLRGLPAAPL